MHTHVASGFRNVVLLELFECLISLWFSCPALYLGLPDFQAKTIPEWCPQPVLLSYQKSMSLILWLKEMQRKNKAKLTGYPTIMSGSWLGFSPSLGGRWWDWNPGAKPQSGVTTLAKFRLISESKNLWAGFTDLCPAVISDFNLMMCVFNWRLSFFLGVFDLSE